MGFTDATKFKELEDFPGLYEVQAKLVTRKGDSIDDSAFGGNASAEEAAEDLEEGEVESGLDVVLDMQYVEAPGDMGKKGYMVHIKEYMKAVKAKLDAEGGDVDTFMRMPRMLSKVSLSPTSKILISTLARELLRPASVSKLLICLEQFLLDKGYKRYTTWGFLI